MLDIQLGRRNLSSIQRIAIVEKYRPIYEKQAKERQSNAGKDYGNGKKKLPPKMGEAKKTKDNETNAKLSKLAGVSKETYRMGAKIFHCNNEELKQEVFLGEKSINAGYKEFERLYGIREGRPEKLPNYSVVKKSQSDLAAQMGISVDTLQNYKLLSEMIPELSDLVQDTTYRIYFSVKSG